MLGKIGTIAFSEARMSSRGWRFWLLLLLLLGLSYFARRDYLLYIHQGFFLHSASSFQHPSFWIMLAVLILGTVSLSLDACGRLRRTGMDKILFPLPVSTLQLFWGLFFGVLLVMLPLSAIGLFSLAIWQVIYGHGQVVWEPFIIAYLYLILPILVPVAAGTITLRTYLKHDFATLLVGIGLLAVIGFYRTYLGIFLDFVELARMLVNSSPTLGVTVLHAQFLPLLAVHLIGGCILLTLAPLYLRRQDPQRYVVNANSRSIFGIPTLARLLTNLRFDKHLGWGYRFTLACSVIVMAAGAIYASYRFQEVQAETQSKGSLVRILETQEIPLSPIDVQKVKAEISPNEDYTQLELRIAETVKAASDVNEIHFELDPLFKVASIRINNETCDFEQKGEWLKVICPTPLAKNAAAELVFQCRGTVPSLHPEYSSLEGRWIPLPWRKVRPLHTLTWIRQENDFFDAELALKRLPEQKSAFAGEKFLVAGSDESIEHWRTFHPVNTLQIFWGNYNVVEEQKPGYLIRFYHLPGHDYQAAIYLEEIKEQESYVREKLGILPFPQLTIIETPYYWDAPPQRLALLSNSPTVASGGAVKKEASDEMPGLIAIEENKIGYLDERMWLMERFDSEPEDIPFYRQIPVVLPQIHDQFYKQFISVYFDHTLQPAGQYSFWLQEHLSSYASKLLEQNPWRRRHELRYDVGTGPTLPLSIARKDSLLALRQEGKYRELERLRGEGLFRMLHHLLTEKVWWEMMKDLFLNYRFQEMTAEEFLKLAEKYYGQPLDWFKEQWLDGNALPVYEITLAEADIVEDKRDFSITYNTQIRVKNHGTGRMAVPIYIETEMDSVFRNIWLDAGQEDTLSVTLPNRPIFAAVDPEFWIVQEPFFDKTRNRRLHSEQRIYIEGAEKGPGRAPKDRDRRGRRGGGFWW